MASGMRGDTPADPPRSEQRRTPRRRPADEPFDIRVEFVVLDGPAGEELARRQAAVIRRVLRWTHDRPDAPPDTEDDGQRYDRSG